MISDRIFGLVVLLVALAYIAGATQIQTSFLSDPVGSKTFPMIIGAIAGLCGLVMMIRPDQDPEWPKGRTFFALIIAVAVLVAYAYSLKPFGFLLPTAVTAAILSYQLSPRIVPAILSGIGLSVGLFILFKFALGLGLIPFPQALTG
ncbi:tripartite tricarboxylate transporter TctB family protein [Leucothrix sargassi]|nr:tripartite tricarboxylate transporter TctB family protein [Leucothrix sargassi]